MDHGATHTSAMTAHSSGLPFPVDPLIAEAKHRSRRRRFFVGLALVAAAVVATMLMFGLRPGGNRLGAAGTVPASPATQDAILAVLRATFLGTSVGDGRVARLHTLVRVASDNQYLAAAMFEPLDSKGRPLDNAAWVVLADRGGQWAIIGGPGTGLDCTRSNEPGVTPAVRQILCSGDPFRGFKPIR
jgi:hypothetical protein